MITVAELFERYDGPTSVNPASALKDQAVTVNSGLAFTPDSYKALKKNTTEIYIQYGPKNDYFVANSPTNNIVQVTVMGRVDASGSDITWLGPNPPPKAVC